MLTVNEIFHSIQGESTRAGDRCVFVRLTACDLRCTWCDTPYAFHEGRKMSIDDVLSVVEGYGCPLVEITGGEPLLQEGVYELMERLLAAGHTVLLETGGHRPIDRVPAGVVKIVDVKCPGSGEADKNHWANQQHCVRPAVHAWNIELQEKSACQPIEFFLKKGDLR
jgi:7-carboxy-7-deazaguanine synthase